MSRNKKQKGPKKFPEDREDDPKHQKRDPRTQGRTQRQKGVTKERGLMNSELTKERSGEIEPSANPHNTSQSGGCPKDVNFGHWSYPLDVSWRA